MNRRAGLVVAASVLLLGLAAPATASSLPVGTWGESTVSAEPDCFSPVHSPDGAAMVCFHPYDERLFICDTLADSHNPAVGYYRSTSPTVYRLAAYSLGAGNCAQRDLADIPESGWVEYRACNTEGSTMLSCSEFVRMSAEG